MEIIVSILDFIVGALGISGGIFSKRSRPVPVVASSKGTSRRDIILCLIFCVVFIACFILLFALLA